MTGSEFVYKIKDLAYKRGKICRFIPERNKAGHGTLYYGARRTIVCHFKSQLKTGAYHAMLKQLDINPQDLR
ncbi:MAG: type II toxin-antitoxin system HicA family toxin [Candidatus Omnitrophota bacterium]